MKCVVTDSGFYEYRREDTLRAARKAENVHHILKEKPDMKKYSIFKKNSSETRR
jgi:hypothetical protein